MEKGSRSQLGVKSDGPERRPLQSSSKHRELWPERAKLADGSAGGLRGGLLRLISATSAPEARDDQPDRGEPPEGITYGLIHRMALHPADRALLRVGDERL